MNTFTIAVALAVAGATLRGTVALKDANNAIVTAARGKLANVLAALEGVEGVTADAFEAQREAIVSAYAKSGIYAAASIPMAVAELKAVVLCATHANGLEPVEDDTWASYLLKARPFNRARELEAMSKVDRAKAKDADMRKAQAARERAEAKTAAGRTAKVKGASVPLITQEAALRLLSGDDKAFADKLEQVCKGEMRARFDKWFDRTVAALEALDAD